MDLAKVRSIISEYCRKKDLKLFEVEYDKSDAILSILLDEEFGMEELEKVSTDLSAYLDGYEDEFDDNYFLDVSTVGVERPIRNEDELIKAVGEYIYVQTKENEYYGTLKAYAEGKLTLEVRDKTRYKDVELDYQECRNVRYAVKF